MRLQFLLLIAPAVLLACGDDGTSGSSTPGSDVLIVQDADTKGTNAYSPSLFTISLADGDEVRWGNNDRGDGYGSSGTTHTVVADDASFDSGNIPPGGTFAHTFAGTGTVGYHCSIHPSMQGTIQINP